MRSKINLTCLLLQIFLSFFLLALSAQAGTWTTITRNAPGGLGALLLLPDGTIMAQGYAGRSWYRLTPDSTGSYINGTWTTLAPMHDTRLYFASEILQDGRVFVAGGEYGSGGNTAEVYDPKTNVWTITPSSGQDYLDAMAEVLPNGNVIIIPVYSGTNSYIYNPVLNTWAKGPVLHHGQDEATWTKLPDSSILTTDPGTRNSERYIPSLDRWITDSTIPVSLWSSLGETGGALLLPDERTIFFGDTGNTAFYTASGNTAPGTWVAGTMIPTVVSGSSTIQLGVPDAPMGMLVNGHVLAAFSQAGTYNSPTYFYEFDPTANSGSGSFTALPAPGSTTPGTTLNAPAFVSTMLTLPDGTMLVGVQGSGQLHEYTPSGPIVTSGTPAITNIASNGDGSYTLTGTWLNGSSEGASYGDDLQMATNYPILRLASGGNVYFAKTYNWSNTGVATGTVPETVQFRLQPGMPTGAYSAVVIASGIQSAPTNFTISSVTPAVSISATTGTTTKGSPAPAVFTITRTGSTTSALTVNFAVSGSGTQGTDFYLTDSEGNTITNSVTIPAGSASATVKVNGIDNGQAGDATTAQLAILNGNNYEPSTSSYNTWVTINNVDVAPTANITLALAGQSSSLIAGYAMNEDSGAVQDVTGNNNATNVNISGNGYPIYDVASVSAGTYGNGNLTLTASQAASFGTAITFGTNHSNFSNFSLGTPADITNLIAAGSPTPTGSFTMMAWVNVPATNGSQRVFATSYGGQNTGWAFGLNGSGLEFTAFGRSDNFSTGGTVVASAWNHVAMTYHNGTVTFFLNGAQLNTISGIGYNQDTYTNYRIGSAANGSEAFFGTMDDLKIYNSVLSLSQIQTAAVTPLPVSQTPNLIMLPVAEGLYLSATATNGRNYSVTNPSLTTNWSQASGPGTVTFGNPASLNTTVKFPSVGQYQLQLSGTNSNAQTVTPQGLTVVVGAPFAHQDLGATGTPGAFAFNNGTLTISSYQNGGEIDDCQYVYAQVSGNFTVTIHQVANSGNNRSWSGLEVRQSLAPGSLGAFLFDSTAATTAEWRTGSNSNYDQSPSRFPWLQMVREGNTIAYNVSTDGVNWTPYVGGKSSPITQTINSLTDPVYVGATAYANSASEVIVVYDNFTVTSGTAPGGVSLLNIAPAVNAGSSQTLANYDPVTLSGSANDDGLPNPPAAVTTNWSQISGPSSITLANPSSLTTSAVFSTPGTYTLQLSANDGAITTFNNVTYTFAPTPIETWRKQNFGANYSNPAISGDTADPDGDGVPNLMEYALNTNPNAPSASQLPTVSVSGSNVMLTYRQNDSATDVTYTVEESADLKTWTPTNITPTKLSDDGSTSVMQVTVPMNGQPTLLLRLKVIEN